MVALPDGRTPVLLTAHAEDLIAPDAAAILAYLDRHPEAARVGSVAATLLATRRVRRHRAVVRAADTSELRAGLAALAAGDEHPLVTRASESGRGRIAFVFPGQGSQWPGMGADAYHRLPGYRAEVDRCAAAFAGAASPRDYLLAPAGAHTGDFSQVQIQGAQFVHGVALARVWRSLGVVPDITVGHSLGEIAAAHVAGVLPLRTAVGVVIARATLLDRLTGPYRVAALGVTEAQAQQVISAVTGWLELSVVNSATSVAVSGERAAVSAAVAAVSAQGKFAKEIEMWFPAHTRALDGLRDQFEALLPAGAFTDTAVPFVGAATGQPVGADADFAGYWWTNLRATVRFDRAVAAAADLGARTFVELSAHPALLFAVAEVAEQVVPDAAVLTVGSGRRGEPITDRLAAGAVAVALREPGCHWPELVERRAPLRDFPFAPMRRQHHWAAAEPLPPVAALTVAVEAWEPLPAADAAPARRVVVLDAAGSPLRDALRAAIDRRSGWRTVGSADADLLVVVAPRSDDLGVADLAARIDGGLLAYPAAIGPSCREVWLVTVGGEQVRPADPVPCAGPAALAAMHRSVGFEYPDQRFAHLDLPSWVLDDATADAAVRALAAPADVVALCDVAYRRVLRDEPRASPRWPAQRFDEVVITGGSGAIAGHYARHLAAAGARRIVLLSRRATLPAGLAVARHGTEVVAVRCDVGDADQVADAATRFGGGGASLLIHAAGTAPLAPHRELTSATAKAAFAAKVTGLQHLVAHWPMRADARMLLCSSVSGRWGGRGHAVYAAANRLLDAAAARLRADGRHCTAVRWGLWQDTGILDADEIARVERSGLRAMDPGRAVEESLRDRTADPLVFSADPGRLRAFLGDCAPGTTPADLDPVSAERDPADALLEALGAVLDVAEPAALDRDASLIDLGVDSLLALDLRKRLGKTTGRTVPLAMILGGASATEVLAHLTTAKATP
ncbi:mycobactin polyketide synthase MbtD [Mycobacterium sp. MYCO198283]|uniref:mycobactin polyketide synthase MbtD n=1 Tax=Mycobacterium sp. MYCO198283 TaxID=2883505 RepID=UPI001E50D8AC|nr:mycobactin polyketide synthase MbtD [Mycobacterium sp. MYCO198283]MCG5432540.1 mycobactin polyketide synthase MbtD [Mycobacterium sp. MYCO198283]